MSSNLLIRMPNWLGDAVMAAPIVTDLRNKFPTARITLMCQGKVGELFLHDPNVDEIFSFKKPKGWLRRIQNRNLHASLRRGGYDTGILLTNSLSTAWDFYKGDVQNRIGFKKGVRNTLLDFPVSFPEEKKALHHVELYKKLLTPLSIPESTTVPELYIDESELEEASAFLQKLQIPSDAKIIGINPGAAYGSAKCWLPERFVEVSKKLLNDPKVHLLYFGDATGAALVEQITSEIPERTVNLAGKTSIRSLMALTKLCSVFLTNDSGPMHIASALRTPLVALFGPTCDQSTGPRGSAVLIHKRVDCAPCFQRTCPIDHRCMREITADEVYFAVLSASEP